MLSEEPHFILQASFKPSPRKDAAVPSSSRVGGDVVNAPSRLLRAELQPFPVKVFILRMAL